MKSNYFKDIKIPEGVNLSVKKGIDRAKKEKRKKMIKSTVSASIAGVVVLGCIITFNDTVYAGIQKTIYDIKSILGVEKDLDNYKTIVNKSITKQGVTITLNEVILDDNELIVCKTISSDKKTNTNDCRVDEELFINGQYAGVMSSGYINQIDEYTIQEVMFYTPTEDIDLQGDLDIKMEISQVYFESVTSSESIKDDWNFEFKSSGAELLADTTEIILDNTFELENGAVIDLKKYTSNNVGQKIYFTTDLPGVGYHMVLRGSDDLNNNIEFELRTVNGYDGVFKLSTVDANLDENAKKLKLTLYAAKEPETSGQFIPDFKKVGDEFTIDLNYK